ncbi:ankyrin repeat-containing domain protein [Hyaloscypha sp. PMI_1271]|nr:ankyrin repeat-containing domain protein [Hyaloscypha sp. PMI_1271]
MRTESQECFKCGDCEKKFVKRRDYNRHRKRHDKPHVCSHPRCKKSFGLKTDLERHRPTHLGRTSQQYVRCFPGCKFKTTRKDYLWKHLQEKHPDKEQHDASRKTRREFYHEFTQGLSTSQQDLKLQLLEAANEGDTAKVRELRSAEVDESVVDALGRTPLHLAAAQGHREIVALLCQNAAIANETLLNAVVNREQKVVEVLIENGVDIDQPGKANPYRRRRTALYLAAFLRQESLSRFLLDHGADVNRRQPDYSHQTALHVAARWSPGVTRILLEANADIEAKDDTGRTPLDHAIRGEDGVTFISLTTPLLLEAGAVLEQRQWDAIPRWFREENPQYAPSTATLLPVDFPITP